MNKTKRIAALPAVLLGGCLALFGGCSPKKFSFEYQDKIYCYSFFDSNLEYAVIDEEAIKSFTDMLNACTIKKLSAQEIESVEFSPGIDGYEISIGKESFYLNEQGYYLEARKNLTDKEGLCFLEGFDADVFNAFVEKRYEGGGPQS